MKISKVSVTLSRSIKMAEYQYYKPEQMVEVTLEAGDSPKEAYQLARTQAEKMLEQTIKLEYDSFGM